jgi:hypothetical protein
MVRHGFGIGSDYFHVHAGTTTESESKFRPTLGDKALDGEIGPLPIGHRDQ